MTSTDVDTANVMTRSASSSNTHNNNNNTKQQQQQQHSTDLKPFVFGGLASCVAEAATFPIDTAKTRLQLQGQRSCPEVRYKGMVHCWTRICAEEGFTSLYRGLAPALLRQASYGTIKFGLYYTIKNSFFANKESALKNVACAVIAGAISSAIASPTDLLKVRLQALNYRNAIRGGGDEPEVKNANVFRQFREIIAQEGVRGLWRGVVPTAQRAAVVAGVQLPVYDAVKMQLLSRRLMDDGAANHLVSSFCAGLCACAASSPMDVVRTRLMNQRKLLQEHEEQKRKRFFSWSKYPPPRRRTTNTISGGGGSGGESGGLRIYKSSIDCAVKTIRSEGFLALYKGFVPAFTRMGPWNVIFFLVYERLKINFAQT